MTDQLSLLPMLDDAEHPTWLLNGKKGIKNENGVYTDNVLKFREGRLSGVYVDVNLCADGNFILYQFSYMAKDYGCGHPLSRPCHECHRNNSPIIGTRAEESFRRAVGWMKSGCNSFAGNRAKSTPLSLWMESDVLRYIDENCIKMSPMYTEGGMKRTGCMFCPVPIAHADYTNIEYARIHYPKMFETIMIKHGLKSMIEFAQENRQLSLF